MKNDEGVDFVKKVLLEEQDQDADEQFDESNGSEDKQAVDAELAEAEPQQTELRRYRVLKPGKIRAGSAMDSPEAGKLVVGEELSIMAQEEVDGVVRVQFARGWASVTSKSGTQLLELID